MDLHVAKDPTEEGRPVKLKESLASLIRTQGFSGRQKKIAEDLGISEAALSHYIKGRSTPSFEKLLSLAEYFDVSLDYLVYGQVEQAPHAENPPDGFVARQVQAALTEAHGLSARRQDLVSRLAQVMVQSLESAVEEIVAQPTRNEAARSARTITNPDAIVLEQEARAVSVVSGWPNEDAKTGRQSGTTIVTAGGVTKPGPFLPVQSSNLKRGVPYRQIVQGQSSGWRERAARVRAGLRGAGVTQEQLDAHLLMKGSEEPIISTFILLRVPDSFSDPSSRVIYERFRPYFRHDGLFAYISIMDDVFQGGLPLAERYRDAAEKIFTHMWEAGPEI